MAGTGVLPGAGHSSPRRIARAASTSDCGCSGLVPREKRSSDAQESSRFRTILQSSGRQVVRSSTGDPSGWIYWFSGNDRFGLGVQHTTPGALVVVTWWVFGIFEPPEVGRSSSKPLGGLSQLQEGMPGAVGWRRAMEIGFCHFGRPTLFFALKDSAINSAMISSFSRTFLSGRVTCSLSCSASVGMS